jgi:hypothetical protein
MEKEFVPYELALRMKQLGFDGSCFAIWSGFDEQNFSITDTIRLYSSGFRINGTQSSKFYINDFNSLRVAAPTYSQAFRWFRKRCSIHCEITQTTDWEEDNESWNFVIYKYRLGNNDGMKDSDVDFNTYEEAELECLKKLIEIVENIK